MESVVEAFNEYYYSPDTGLYVKREFLKASEEVKKAAAKLRIQLSVDREGRINNITYHEAKKLFEHLGLTMMSLSEYWLVLKEAEASHDEQMLSHLRSRGFVELLDTVILDGKVVIDHPQVTFTDEEPNYLGERHEVVIPQALPGLIYPEDIDFKTGFPKVVHGSTHFDKRTWRYWSPDAPVCIATRGHIFLLDQPALDTKIHPDDALKNLGIRPCCYKVKPPKVEIVQEEKGIRAVINKE